MNSFYSVLEQNIADQTWLVKVKLSPDHPVYAGHFPDNPVAPGVMLVYMIKDIIEKQKDQELVLKSARNIKFLKIVAPENPPHLELNFTFSEDSDIVVRVHAEYNGEIYFKISATFA